MLPENFIFYRFPNESKIYFGEILNSSKPAKESSGNVMLALQSFDKSISKELLLKQHDYKDAEIQELLSNVDLPEYNSTDYILNKDEYIRLCSKFIEETKTGSLQKVILSRVKKVKCVNNICKFYKHLCHKSKTSFTYLLNYKGELWIGSTPEILTTIQGLHLETMALAGTLQSDKINEWTFKEIEEHNMVRDYIVESLHMYNPVTSITDEITLGNIKHLITKINARLHSTTDANSILNSLHPTPAVCGLPKENAFNFILENEPHNRKLYTGYLGIKDNEKQRYYVNLRCGQFYKDRTLLYVGGGLTSDSNPLDEFNETEYKSQALYSKDFF